MINLKSETETPPRRSRLPRLFVLLVLVAVVALVIERWRGQWALKSWKSHMAAQGEIFDAKRLWPPSSARSLEFSNRLAQVIRELPPRLASYAGQLSGIVQEQPGQGRRGSQEPYPPMAQKGTSTNTWDDLDVLVGQAQPALESLRQLMKDPPPDMGDDIMERLGTVCFPNFVNVLRSAQALHAAAMNDLHKGNLPGALENLTALAGFVRLYADDPGLVNLSIRMAITGLSVDVCWDALQAKGWTEPQLAALQQACQDDKLLLAQMARSMEAERAIGLHDLGWLRSHSYDAWVARYQRLFESHGWRTPAGFDGPLRCWRQYAFHPLWKFAWADQEELIYLRTVQGQIMVLRKAAKHGAWLTLNQQMATHYRNFRPPFAAWRFYAAPPLLEGFPGIIRGWGASAATYPYAAFSWSTTMKNLTLRHMVSAAVGLKRYELRHGQLPQSLALLVPEFLAEAPQDCMDGQPLRYRLSGDGAFALYSIGEDGQDEGGDPSTADSDQERQTTSPWAGRDWVWPRAVADAKAGAS
jgi:hypothetical protein